MKKLLYEDDVIKIIDKYYDADECNGSDVAMDIMSEIINLPSAQPEVKVLRVPYTGKPVDIFDALTEEEKQQNKWWAEGYSDAMKELSAQSGSRIEQSLHGKSPEEQYDFLQWLLLDYGHQFTDTKRSVIDWLKGEKE